MSGPLLHIQDLHKSYGHKHVLRGVNLDVAPGQSLVIIGGSGTGKSVTLRCALGLERADRGEIAFDGLDLVANPDQSEALRCRTGMLCQGGALFDSLPIWENVAFRLIHANHISRRDAKDIAIETLAKVKLPASVAEQFPSELSGGMQKRAALARAIAAKPDMVFFDEPTTGLDPITAAAINDLIVEQVKGIGAASIAITHDMASARVIADEIAMIFEGRIVWRGPAADIDTTDDPMIRQFVDGKSDGPIQTNPN